MFENIIGAQGCDCLCLMISCIMHYHVVYIMYIVILFIIISRKLNYKLSYLYYALSWLIHHVCGYSCQNLQ